MDLSSRAAKLHEWLRTMTEDDGPRAKRPKVAFDEPGDAPAAAAAGGAPPNGIAGRGVVVPPPLRGRGVVVPPPRPPSGASSSSRSSNRSSPPVKRMPFHHRVQLDIERYAMEQPPWRCAECGGFRRVALNGI
eukprot:13791485-Alexandrium_andersonii.AAC.1